jgi:hypothetical protein
MPMPGMVSQSDKGIDTDEGIASLSKKYAMSANAAMPTPIMNRETRKNLTVFRLWVKYLSISQTIPLLLATALSRCRTEAI